MIPFQSVQSFGSIIENTRNDLKKHYEFVSNYLIFFSFFFLLIHIWGYVLHFDISPGSHVTYREKKKSRLVLEMHQCNIYRTKRLNTLLQLELIIHFNQTSPTTFPLGH